MRHLGNLFKQTIPKSVLTEQFLRAAPKYRKLDARLLPSIRILESVSLQPYRCLSDFISNFLRSGDIHFRDRCNLLRPIIDHIGFGLRVR